MTSLGPLGHGVKSQEAVMLETRQASSVNVFAQIPSDMSVKLHGHAKENSVLCGDAVSTTGAGCPLPLLGVFPERSLRAEKKQERGASRKVRDDVQGRLCRCEGQVLS